MICLAPLGILSVIQWVLLYKLSFPAVNWLQVFAPAVKLTLKHAIMQFTISQCVVYIKVNVKWFLILLSGNNKIDSTP